MTSSASPPDQPPNAGDAFAAVSEMDHGVHHHDEFERLLHLLHYEHAKLNRENKALREAARQHSMEAQEHVRQSETTEVPQSEAAEVGGSSPGGKASTELARSARSDKKVPTRSGSMFKFQGHLDHQNQRADTGTSKHTRELVAKHMERLAAEGGQSTSTFSFRGAKDLKKKLKWVRNNNFDYFMAVVILLNAVYIGIETSATLSAMQRDYANGEIGASNGGKFWLIGDVVFAIIFVAELVIRLLAYQVKFYMGTQKWWNCFDVITILATVVAASFEIADAPPNFILGFFKVLRLARLVRSLKISKSRIFHNLKTLSYTVAGSANAFSSAIVFLLVVMYVFGVMFMQGVQEYLQMPTTDPLITAKMDELFGNIGNTAFTLLNCITGGINWKEVAVLLNSISPSYKWVFGLYITFTVLCVLNILNGVFVSVAIESAQTNKELAIETTRYKTNALINQMIAWFLEADKDMSNKVSWDELHDLLKDDNVSNFFRANGIDVTSAAQIFVLLDRDGTGELEPEEFVDNLIHLQGQAKAVDLASLRLVCDEMSERMVAMGERLEKLAPSEAQKYLCTGSAHPGHFLHRWPEHVN